MSYELTLICHMRVLYSVAKSEDYGEPYQLTMNLYIQFHSS